MGVERTGVDHLGHELVDGAGSNQAHVHLELIAENLNRTLNTFLAVAGERVQEAAANTDGRCSERNGLQDVTCAADTSVDEYGEVGVWPWALGLQRSDNIDEVLEARTTGVELPTTVVTEDDTLAPGFVGQDGVFGGRHTLEDDVHWAEMRFGTNRIKVGTLTVGYAPEPWNILPGQAGVDERLGTR